MRAELKKEKELAETRMHILKQDLAVLESKKERLEQEEANLILKLVETRERILANTEQDE